jgi:hypothetical protein
MTVAQAFLSMIVKPVAAFVQIAGSVEPTCCDVACARALRFGAPTRQYFLKRDSVFFNVLVYSGCSAFRFPSARSE